MLNTEWDVVHAERAAKYQAAKAMADVVPAVVTE